MSIKEDVYRIIDGLPESDLEKLLHHLERVQAAKNDPFLQALLNAPIDDEPYTPEEQAEDEEAWQEYLRGEGRNWKDVRAELPQ